MNANQNPIHGEFSSTDASALNEANSRIKLYNRDGVEITSLGSTDQVIITDLVVSAAGADLTVTVYDGADATPDVGEIISRGKWPEMGGVAEEATTPHYCKAGTFPKVKTTGAGQVYVQIRGHIATK